MRNGWVTDRNGTDGNGNGDVRAKEAIRRLDNLRRRLSVAVASGRMTAREAADLLVDEMLPSVLQIRRR